MDEDLRHSVAKLMGADRLPAAIVAVLYALLGIAWTEVTDRAVSAAASDPATLTALHTYKGWIFVLGTAVILYILLRGVLSLRRQALKRGAEKERFLSSLMKNLPGMVYRRLPDPEGTMEYMSFGVGPLTGYAAEEFIGRRSVHWPEIIHPEDRERVRAEVDEAVQRRRRFRVEYRIQTRGGETKWVWEQGSAVFSDAGEPRALEGFVIDVTGVRMGTGESPAPGFPATVPLGAPARRVTA